MKTKNNFSREHLLYVSGLRRKSVFINVMRVAVLVIFLSAWEILYRCNLIDGFIFSAPSRIFASIAALFKSGDIYLHVGITLYETLMGFFIATGAGTLIALLLWWNSSVRRIAEPYVVVLNGLPKIALGPIIIIWFGSGTKSIIVIAVLITVIVTTITMLTAFMQTEESKLFLMHSLGASKLQILLKLVIPSSVPSFISMLKINIGLSWIGSIMGEYLVSRAGIGYLIVYGSQIFKLDLVYASTLLLCALATAMYSVVGLIERRLVDRRK